MSEERKKLYKSVEDEHRRIIASRMEKLVTEKLHTSQPPDKSNSQENTDNRISSFLNHDKTLEVRQHTVWIKKIKENEVLAVKRHLF